MRNRLLIVDDEAGVRFGLKNFLSNCGFEVQEAESARAAEEAFRTGRPDAVVLDYSLPDESALDLLPRLKALDGDVPVVILTGHGSIDLAVRAIKMGAEQFLTKPVELPALRIILERLLENQRNRRKDLADKKRQRRPIDPFLGSSTAIRKLAENAHKVLASDSPILIAGETGSGKGVLAAWLHANSRRAEETFIDLNCAGLNRELLESELFGHEKGAFTGATANKAGLLEVAHRGTVFLDEIGDMDLQIQPKLLKVLEEKRFRRIGDVADRVVDIRLIAATHQELPKLVEAGKFRSDLFYRISTLPLSVPPLRERREDMPVLAGDLLDRLAGDLGRSRITVSPEALATLQGHPWAGNIRELRNVLERAVLLGDRNVLEVDDLRFDTAHRTPQEPANGLTLEEVEIRHIRHILQECGGAVKEAAERLGIPRSTLYQKLKQYGIEASKA